MSDKKLGRLAARISVAAACVCFLGSAGAGMIVLEAAPQASVPAVAGPLVVDLSKQAESLPAIRVRGTAPKNIDKIGKSGADVSFGSAMKTIVPKGWTGFVKGDGIREVKRVSWEGGRTWTAVLESILKDNALMADIDWTKKEITFYAVADAALMPAANSR